MPLRLRTRPPIAGFIEPCLPTTAARPPEGPGWLHEIKHDGYRLLARKDAARVPLITRRGIAWTERFPLIAEAASALPCKSCLIDGEAVACDDRGLADFQLLRRRGKPVILYAFDLLLLDGKDLRGEPIEYRKASLAKLLRKATGRGIELNEHIEGIDSARVFAHACKLGFEGIVSKRKGSKYQSGRSWHWLKMKNRNAPATKRERDEDWN